MFTLGGTAYLDEEKSWTLSVLSRYEMHSKKDGEHVRPGDDLHFEWGLGKSFKQGFEVGAVGYCEWQVSPDRGSGVYWGHYNRDRVYAVGPEANYFIKQIGVHASLRYEREFGAQSRPEGNTTTLSFTKKF
jgi:hypothetical protein